MTLYLFLAGIACGLGLAALLDGLAEHQLLHFLDALLKGRKR